MSLVPEENRQELEHARDKTVAALQDAYTRDLIGLDTLEERLGQAEAASSRAELAPLTAGLPGIRIDLDDQRLDVPVQRIDSILSEQVMRGDWLQSRRVQAKSVLASIVLDLRDVELPAGRTEIDVFAALASIEIIAPPGTKILMDVSAIAAEVQGETIHRRPPEQEAYLEIVGKAVLASVEVKERPK